MATLDVLNPFNQNKLTTLEMTSSEELESYLAQAAELHAEGPLAAGERSTILTRTAGLLEERMEDFALTIAREGGKPLKDARVEANRAVEGIRNAVEEMHTMVGRCIPMRINEKSAHQMAFTVREPIGPVVALSAFNHPLNLIVHQVVPAVATGCPVLAKPAPDTPLSCIHFVDLLREAGLPEEWCRAVVVDNDLAEKLATDPRVAFLSFIGSAQVGWMLRSKLAPGTRCALEHGGAAPAVIERDADLGKAIAPIVKGGYYHAGQVCVSVQRIFVQVSILDAFLEKFVSAVEALKTGDASNPETDVGPLIRPHEVLRVDEWVREAAEAGGRILTGGRTLGKSLYAPTVVLDPPDSVRLSREEVFGPVTAVYPFAEEEEAVARANQLDLAFQAAVYSESIDRAMFYAHRLSGAAVMINQQTAFRVDWMPFAGRQHSGYGTGGIPYTMEDMTQEKLILIKSSGIPE